MARIQELAKAGFLVPFLSAGAAAQEGSVMPDRAFYFGLGGGFSDNHFGSQTVYALGTSDIFMDGDLIATGIADGPAPVDVPNASGLVPSVQAGYFHHMPGGEWILGGKFTYNYLNSSSSVENIRLPQAGSFTYTETGVTEPFLGNAVARNFKSTVKHQIALVPYVGRSFGNGFVYFGAGPTLTETQTDIDGLVGFADINDTRRDISGAPQNFSASDWVVGGTATVGLTYFLDSSWFVDASYSYATTRDSRSDFVSTYQYENTSNGQVTVGDLIGDSTGRVATQSIVVTLNMAF